MSNETWLVTGALGCIGAWCVRHLVRDGRRAVAFDLGDDRHRLDLLLAPEEQGAIAFVRGDVASLDDLTGAIRAHDVTRVLHLAALQVPLCKEDPVGGARVNVAGTAAVFEAARRAGIRHLAYASSVAVHGPPSLYGPGLVRDGAPLDPRTLYGVYKVANEGTARVFFRDHGVGSTGLRPYTVYGPGRDQGLTSAPTRAMLAAAAGRPHHIPFGGRMQLQYAPDVARLFLDAAAAPLEGAFVFNLGGPPVAIPEVVETIRRVRPGARITCAEEPLPFPEGFDDAGLRRRFPEAKATPLEEGVRRTVEVFETCLHDGRIRLEPE